MELLNEWSKQRHIDPELWDHLIRFLRLSFEVDEGGELGDSLQGRLDADNRQRSGGMTSFASYRNR